DIARRRKKSTQKMSKIKIAGRRFVATIKVLGRLVAPVALVAFVISIFFFASASDRFNIGSISIYGCKELDPRELEEAVRQEFSGNILRLDLQQMKQRLEKKQWVQRVEIRRVLPGDLIIYVQERVPSVILEMQHQLMVADDEGILLGPYSPRFGRLDVPVFKGILGTNAESYRLNQEENSARIRQGRRMLSEIASGSEEYAGVISEVDISDPDNLKIILMNDPVKLYLGEKDYLKRFLKFMNNPKEYQELKARHSEIETIDLRFDRQIIYRLRQTENPAPENITAKFDDQR
ncbi:MAG TPA: FtsQ-type POTRA domain-containing protein, partial [Acidobacteriota bacterium]|nr:FtsQ-type POTRA domain-containing protein [Acidobacteriota bacterium]